MTTCPHCATEFVPRDGKQVTCGADRCRWRRAWELIKRRPDVVARNRARCQRWAATHRNVHTPQPWLVGPPPFAPYLPGGACEITISPVPRWPIELRNARALHGVLTALTKRRHGQHPAWSLIPWQSGWAVYWYGDDDARRFAGTRHAINLFHADREIRFSHLARFRAPVVTRRGRTRLRVDTITPATLSRHGHKTALLPLTSEAIEKSLRALGERFGIDSPVKADPVRHELRRALVSVGGHWQRGTAKPGLVVAWEGWFEADCNAPAAWLMRVAERVGFGGTTAIGFGRVRVSEVDRA